MKTEKLVLFCFFLCTCLAVSIVGIANSTDVMSGRGEFSAIGGEPELDATIVILNEDQSALLWNKTFGGSDFDSAGSLIQTSDGGFALAGGTYSFGAGNTDAYLVKTDDSGNMLWNMTYGGPGYDWASSLIQTSDRGYALAGYTESFGAGRHDAWLIKTDSNGGVLWYQTYGGQQYDWAKSLVEMSDGGYAIAGFTNSSGAGGCDIYFVRTDAQGTMLWNRTYGGDKNDEGWSMVVADDGGFAIAGYTTSFGVDGDAWLVRTDLNGNLLWNKTYGGSDLDLAYSVIKTQDGGYALAGYTYSFGEEWGDMFLVKTDSNGDQLWTNRYGGPYTSWAYSVVQTNYGGYLLAGFTQVRLGESDAYLVGTDASGSMLWNATYGGPHNEEATSLIRTSDGRYAFAGTGGYYDMYLAEIVPEFHPILLMLFFVLSVSMVVLATRGKYRYPQALNQAGANAQSTNAQSQFARHHLTNCILIDQ